MKKSYLIATVLALLLGQSAFTGTTMPGGRLTGVNWFGFETSSYVTHGLWTRDYKSMLQQIKDLGFNCVRIPWCNAMIGQNPNGIQVNEYTTDPYTGQQGINVDLAGLASMEVLDKIIAHAGTLGLKIILDNHSRAADGYMNEDLWYTDAYSEARWISDWQMMANRYRNASNVVGYDLNNEPHDRATWGEGTASTNWDAAAARCGQAILAINPNALIMVEGVEVYNGDTYWWGGHLAGVRDYPITSIPAANLVYSPHDYGPTVFPQTWFTDPSFPSNMPGIWDEHFWFIYKQGIAPVLLGEFGIKEEAAANPSSTDYVWFTNLMAYVGNQASWTFWCFNPNSGDTGGILKADWVSVETAKYNLLKPYLAGGSTNNPPSVSISSPSNGAMFVAPANITINASASDSDGSVTQVQFYQGSTLLGTDTSSPYSYTWSNVAAGSYSLTARATDNAGAVTTSSAVSVTVTGTANNPPAVSISSPANGATFTAPANITINASASDSDGTISSVAFYQGSTLLGTDTSSPYSYTWSSVATGSYSLTARATDDDGATTTSTAVNITVSSVANNPPTVSISSPASGATFTAPASITINATASDSDGTISSVAFYQGSTLLGTDTSSPYSYTWSGVAAGSYSLTARATDNGGAITTSTAVSITVSSTTGGTLFEDGFESNFDKWTDGGTTDWDRTTSQRYSGSYSAHAGSADNDLTSDNINTGGLSSFVIDVWFRDDDIDNDDNIYLQLYNGSAYANFYELGNSTEDTWIHYTVTITDSQYMRTNFRIRFEGTSIDTGENLWIDDVKITSGGGTTNNPPTVSISSPANGATFTAPASITINATASDSDGTISSVAFYQGSTLLGTDTTSPYSYTWSSVAAGSYSLTARATDNGGAITTSSAVSITVGSTTNNPPTVSISSPANGATFTAPASVTINAAASDSDGTISSVAFYQGSTLLGTDTSSPYSYTWSNVAAGSYSLTARATDNGGAITTSTAVNITVSGTQTGCTCDAGCDSRTTITSPFTRDGVGEFCFEATSLGSYVNSWNLAALEINGVNFTNVYVGSANYPAPIDGRYYIYYRSTVAWGHFEVRN